MFHCLGLNFKAKLMLESLNNKKIRYGRQVTILKVTSLKINRPLPTTTNDMHMKHDTEIPKRTPSYSPEIMPPTESRI